MAALATGERSAREVLADHLARLDAAPAGAVVARDDVNATARAHLLDEAYARHGPVGPLHGLPVTVKDWIDAAGLPCAGEGDDAARRPEHDATAVARLRAAGAIVVAKTNVGVEHRLHGPCAHPLDPARSPGGSSSGEAAVVAAGASPLGLGSDSGGSIRLPAAWCGVAGLKPTFGRVPLTGHFPRVGPLHDGRTVIGPLARTVDDLALALTVLAGPDGLDAACPPVPPGPPATVAGHRLAWLVDDGGATATAEVAAAVARAVEALARAGAEVAAERPPPFHDEALDVTERYWARTTLDGPGNDRLLWDWDRFRRRLLAATAGLDLLLGPAVAGEAPLRRRVTTDDYRFTLPASLLGWPAVVVPVGHGPSGLPLAVQVTGRPWTEPLVLAAAAVVERAVG